MIKSRISTARYLLLFLLPALVTIGWVTAILTEAPTFVSFLSFIFAVLAWQGYLTIPFEFELTTENSIVFRAVLRKVIVQVSDVREIDARSWNKGLVTFRMPHATLFLFRAMPELKNLIETVKGNNPAVRLRGNL